VEKKHISYEKRAINDKKVELIKDMLIGDPARKEKEMNRSID
jgi:hypothetical protein